MDDITNLDPLQLIDQALDDLLIISRRERHDMLTYLFNMAKVEVAEIERKRAGAQPH